MDKKSIDKDINVVYNKIKTTSMSFLYAKPINLNSTLKLLSIRALV